MAKARTPFIARILIGHDNWWVGHDDPVFEAFTPTRADALKQIQDVLIEMHTTHKAEDGRDITGTLLIEINGTVTYLKGVRPHKSGGIFYSGGLIRIEVIETSASLEETIDETDRFFKGAGVAPPLYNADGKRITQRWVSHHATSEDAYAKAARAHARLAGDAPVPNEYWTAYALYQEGEYAEQHPARIHPRRPTQ